MTRIAVHDSSVLIDLSNGDLLEAYLRIGYTTQTTDFIVREVAKDSQPIADWLRTHAHITTYGPRELLTLKQRHLTLGPRLSLEDASALYLAKDHGALLLTNDKQLRKTAQAHDVPVGGILMLMDALHERRILTGRTLVTSLEKILHHGARLPAAACHERHLRWSRA